jgi:hypothetical protein
MPEWLTFSIVKDIALAVLALYGAVLSTFNWRQSVRRDKRSVIVSASTAMPTYDDGRVGNAFAKIEATNAGHRVVTITLLTFETESGGRLFPMMSSGFPIADTRLPASLADGRSAAKYMSYQDIADALVKSGRTEKTKLMPVCEDSVGGVYRGEPWSVDPQEFARM